MALIPGILPTGTCYGTPQDLLELFAQFLDIPAFTVSSKVLYSSGISPDPATDYLWVNTANSKTTLNVYETTVQSYLEYPFAGNAIGSSPYSETLISGKSQITSVDINDQFLVSQTGTKNVLKRVIWSDIVKSIPAGNITYPMLSTSSTISDNINRRVARAFLYYDQTIGLDSSSYNVSSMVYNGNGSFTVNFPAGVFPDGKYAAAVLNRTDFGGESPGPWVNPHGIYSSVVPTATSVAILTGNFNVRSGWTGNSPPVTQAIAFFR